jgi:hypothetical protein
VILLPNDGFNYFDAANDWLRRSSRFGVVVGGGGGFFPVFSFSVSRAQAANY